MKRTTKRIITISSVLVVILALLCTGVSLYINSIFDRIEKIPEVSKVDPSNEFFETDPPEESQGTATVIEPEDIGWGEIEPFLDDTVPVDEYDKRADHATGSEMHPCLWLN